jgi:hypothetical protein
MLAAAGAAADAAAGQAIPTAAHHPGESFMAVSRRSRPMRSIDFSESGRGRRCPNLSMP